MLCVHVWPTKGDGFTSYMRLTQAIILNVNIAMLCASWRCGLESYYYPTMLSRKGKVLQIDFTMKPNQPNSIMCGPVSETLANCLRPICGIMSLGKEVYGHTCNVYMCKYSLVSE